MDTYEKKLALAKEALDSGSYDKETIEYIFPELKESEDERIRKKIIATIHLYYGEPLEDEAKEMIAWLERQGEKKPLGFNIGDEITVNGQICKVIAVEQKPAEWSSEQRKILQTDDVPNESSTAAPLRTGAIGFDGEPMESKQGEQKPNTDFSDLRTWKYIVDAVLTEKEGIGQYLDSPFTEVVAKKLQKRFGKIEQKPAWSKDDEKTFSLVLKNLYMLLDNAKGCSPDWVFYLTNAIQFIKSLKDRVQPQPKSDWSEEDEMMLGKCIDAASGYYSPEDKQSMKDWLKSLRLHSQWKPSDEQMKGIECAIKTLQHQLNVGDKRLNSLYDNLKKLKE